VLVKRFSSRLIEKSSLFVLWGIFKILYYLLLLLLFVIRQSRILHILTDMDIIWYECRYIAGSLVLYKQHIHNTYIIIIVIVYRETGCKNVI